MLRKGNRPLLDLLRRHPIVLSIGCKAQIGASECNRGSAACPWSFGLDIGTTSVGFAVIDHDSELATGKIHRLGVRIFPEARDPKGVPLNQERRQARLRRRQLRRRRERRRLLGEQLHAAGLLPSRNSSDWDRVNEARSLRSPEAGVRRRDAVFRMKSAAPSIILRSAATSEAATSTRFPTPPMTQPMKRTTSKATSAREQTVQALRREDKTLGAWLAGEGTA